MATASALKIHKRTMSNLYISMNAWQEILARAFDGFEMQKDVQPDWLINPSTNRRLKLDRYFPQAGVAIRFADLTGRGQRRQSDWELLEAEQRDLTRVELCRLHDVQLVIVVLMDDPIKALDGLARVLSRASRVLAQGDRAATDKAKWMPALSAARGTVSDIRRLVAKNPEQMMANLAESWRDREMGLVAELGQNATDSDDEKSSQRPILAGGDFVNGQRVRHTAFGDGVITDVTDVDGDAMITVLFDATGARNFLQSLVADKLEIIG